MASRVRRAWWSRTFLGCSPRAEVARPLVTRPGAGDDRLPAGPPLVSDRGFARPPQNLALELAALEVVAVTEELTWGAIVEPELGPAATAALFGAKHVVIDGRWRRGLGLYAFWMGLAAQRRRWPVAAMLVHAALNGAGVVQGHVSGRDRF